GASSVQTLAFSVAFVACSNSGWPDVVIINGHVYGEISRVDHSQSYLQSAQLFRNMQNGTFTDISADAGADFTRKIVGRGMAVGDYDGDGREDLLVVNEEGAPLLLHNDDRSGNHWLTIRCLRTKNGADAIGARITLRAGGHLCVSEVKAGGSYLSSDAPQVHFGAGKASVADLLEVRWPGGKVDRWQHVTLDRSISIWPGATLAGSRKG
ncbi:MAG TPA: CRTAC1 family protein, partial [Chthonomonadales bacterium]|nr:CRTAC1 family protein [Chthonomonadales bacterium]